MSANSTNPGVTLSGGFFVLFMMMSFFFATILSSTLSLRVSWAFSLPIVLIYLSIHVAEFNLASRNQFTNNLFDFLLLKTFIPVFFQICLAFVCFQFKRDLNRVALFFQEKKSITDRAIRIDSGFIVVSLLSLFGCIGLVVQLILNAPGMKEEEEVRASSFLLLYTTFSSLYIFGQLERINRVLYSDGLMSKIYLQLALFLSHCTSLIFLRNGLQNLTFFIMGFSSFLTDFFMLIVCFDAIYPTRQAEGDENPRRINLFIERRGEAINSKLEPMLTL